MDMRTQQKQQKQLEELEELEDNGLYQATVAVVAMALITEIAYIIKLQNGKDLLKHILSFFYLAIILTWISKSLLPTIGSWITMYLQLKS